MGAAALEIVEASKTHGATRALDGVSFALEAGRVHALVGRNGAGKSTLVKILAGATRPDRGEVRVRGRAVTLDSPRAALEHGIATVHQELSLVGELSVAENLLLGRLPRRRGLPLIDTARLGDLAREILEPLGLVVDPKARVASLSFAERQVIEIARAASREPAVLLLDEPTSALSRREADALFALVERLAARGTAVLLVTHRLDELPRVAHVVTVLRDGRVAQTLPAAGATPERLAPLMFGARAAAAPRRAERPRRDRVVLAARGLASGPRLASASLELREGEILGIAGLLGSGRTELLHALFGARPADAGEIELAGARMRCLTPRRAVRGGLALVPEDRQHEGLALSLSVLDNASLPSLHRMTRAGFLRRAWQRAAVEPILARLDLTAGRLQARAGSLSGGNQQKVVVGKWLVEPRSVLLLDEPTKGIDLEARAALLARLVELADEGLALIVVSSELDELLDICDRIAVLREGRLVATLDPRATTLPALLAATMGAPQQATA